MKKMLLALSTALALGACGNKSPGTSDGGPDGGSPPTVTSTSPANGATKTGLLQAAATFSRKMNAATLTATSFTVAKGTTAVAGSVAYDDALATATFTAAAPLDYATVYTATLTTAAKDAAGIALGAPYTWSFTTKTNLEVQAGDFFNVALQDDGTVWTWGQSFPNGSCCLGRDTYQTGTETVPTAIALSNVRTISAGETHTLAVTADSKVYAWGANEYGQLGDGTTTLRTTPVAVSLPALPVGVSLTAVSAGATHSLALASNGTVYSWGFNASGQLGDGTTTERHAPALVPGLSDVTAIAAGNEHTTSEVGAFSLALKGNGTVWGWGSNLEWELAHADGANGGADSYPSPVQLPGVSGIVAIAAGYEYAGAVTSGGTVYVWGGNSVNGQLGQGACGPETGSWIPHQVKGAGGTGLLGNVKKIVAGRFGSATAYFFLSLKDDGTVWGWGDNTRAELGDGTLGVTEACGGDPGIPNLRLYPVQAVGLPAVKAFATGAAHSLGLAADGTVWAWGDNTNGLLGAAGAADPALTPTKLKNF